VVAAEAGVVRHRVDAAIVQLLLVPHTPKGPMSHLDSHVQRSTDSRRSNPASRGSSRWPATFRAAARVLPLLLALAAIPRSASAQGGGMGGMGMGGGRGGRGGGRGGRSGGETPAQHGPSSGDIAKQYEELASLDRALEDVPDLDRQKKDSLKAIEDTYGKIFKSYAIVARNKVDSARAAGGMPDVDDMHRLRVDADGVRSRELVAARAVLSTDEQRARFDGNVAAINAAEGKRKEQMRSLQR
jgi:Spy/CpxP family protein refolding chaperone